MSWSDQELKEIFEKTGGYCRYCKKSLVFKDHGGCKDNASAWLLRRGAWEVDHDMPTSRGGSDDISNLWPACCDCNDKKSDMTGEEYMRERREKGK